MQINEKFKEFTLEKCIFAEIHKIKKNGKRNIC